jgi:hypothetical protein
MPLWRPGSAHGYHARTFGFLIDELVRRVAETSISKYWRTIFAGPLTLDFWIGLPDELNSRCAAIYRQKPEFRRNRLNSTTTWLRLARFNEEPSHHRMD